MKWITALIIGAALGVVLPTAYDGRTGQWMHSWAGVGTIRPLQSSPGLLLSIPLFLGVAALTRWFFNWHDS
ncbi:hypothetical protein H8M03_11650 [Sphingomonas sabuli]|uniref:Uncharacterized protein n=1 Tax=Sphingomonas sabuli TaxID=2764186 RepID=A0A7G9L1Y7_9SPHN|nr:hypothetical protein [Sphingomonas sabuli]QNM82636.1 hypothetical protein H8M03_11650 [Sphingomonas sabuli]